MIKEVRQAFGLLVGKIQAPSDTLKVSFKISSISFGSNKPNITDQGKTKATLRRLLMKNQIQWLKRLQMEQTGWWMEWQQLQ